MTSSQELLKFQQALRESRSAVASDYAELLSQLNIQKRFSESFRSHPLRWIGGAASAGLLATLFGWGKGKSFRRSKVSEVIPSTVKVASSLGTLGWLTGALEVGKLLYPALRPVIVEFLGSAARAAVSKRSRQH